MNRRRRRSKTLATVAAVTALGVFTGTGPSSVAFAQGGKKAPAAKAKPAAPVDTGATAPDDSGKGRRIGLRDALKVAVRQNPTLASETIDVAIAEAEIKSTYSLDDWLLDAGANWSSARFQAVPDAFQSPLASDSFKFDGTLVKPLSDGGLLGLSVNETYSKDRVLFNVPGQGKAELEYTSYRSFAALTFVQPLLRGFGEENRGTKFGVSRAGERAKRDVESLEREAAAGTLVRDVVQAYWELAYAAQELEIRKQSLALAREQLRITQAGIEVGKLAKTESLSVEQVIASREEEVLLAEQNLADRSIELRRLIGMEIGPGEIELTATDHLDTPANEPDLDKTLAAAMENNPQLKTVRALGKAASVEVAVTNNGLLPQLDFNAAVGPQGVSNTLSDSLSEMSSFDTFALVAGVKFSTAFGNHGAKGKHEAAEGKLRKAKLTEQDISAQIAAQVVRAVNLVRSAKKRMDVSAKASTLAKQNVDLEKARWEVGRTTNFEVLKRQDELAQSQLREARARADYLKAVSVLDSLTGGILPRYGIELTKS